MAAIASLALGPLTLSLLLLVLLCGVPGVLGCQFDFSQNACTGGCPTAPANAVQKSCLLTDPTSCECLTPCQIDRFNRGFSFGFCAGGAQCGAISTGGPRVAYCSGCYKQGEGSNATCEGPNECGGIDIPGYQSTLGKCCFDSSGDCTCLLRPDGQVDARFTQSLTCPPQVGVGLCFGSDSVVCGTQCCGPKMYAAEFACVDGACCFASTPPGFPHNYTLCSPGGGCCDVSGAQCMDGLCCVPSQHASNGQCCPMGLVGCGVHGCCGSCLGAEGLCCQQGDKLCGGACCPLSCIGDEEVGVCCSGADCPGEPSALCGFLMKNLSKKDAWQTKPRPKREELFLKEQRCPVGSSIPCPGRQDHSSAYFMCVEREGESAPLSESNRGGETHSFCSGKLKTARYLQIISGSPSRSP